MDNLVITIARQYGSGGREIGVRVAQLLGIKSFDKELIKLAAYESGLAPEVVTKADERATNSLLYTLSTGFSSHASGSMVGYDAPVNDKIFIAQSNMIKTVVEADDCVIIGRCADYVLRDHKRIVRVFICGDTEDRIKRVADRQSVSEAKARELIKKTDKRRANYYNFYTGQKWGNFGHYDMIINSSLLGLEGTARLIAELAKKYSEIG